MPTIRWFIYWFIAGYPYEKVWKGLFFPRYPCKNVIFSKMVTCCTGECDRWLSATCGDFFRLEVAVLPNLITYSTALMSFEKDGRWEEGLLGTWRSWWWMLFPWGGGQQRWSIVVVNDGQESIVADGWEWVAAVENAQKSSFVNGRSLVIYHRWLMNMDRSLLLQPWDYHVWQWLALGIGSCCILWITSWGTIEVL